MHSQENKITDLMPIILSFLEAYYRHKPKTSFKNIRSTLENIYSGQEAMKLYSLEEVKSTLAKVFSLLIPQDPPAFDSLEASLKKIIQGMSEIESTLPTNSIERRLLSRIFSDFLHLDLPSFSYGWCAFGSLLSIFFILLSKQNKQESTSEKWLLQMKKIPFFQMMFRSS